MAVDKVLATKLREDGLGYKEIAQQLGCSEAWCKIYLKHVKKNTAEKAAIKHCIELARSEDAITNSGIKQGIRSVYPFEDSKECALLEKKAMTRFKNAINKAPNTVIRPYWMQPQNAQLSLDGVLEAVNDISMRMDDEVDAFRKKFNLNQSYDKSLRYTIIKMLYCSNLLPEGIENYCDYLSKVVSKLNGDYTPSNTISNSADMDIPFDIAVYSGYSDEYECNLVSLDDI